MDYTYQGRACNILSEVSRPCSPRRHSAYHTVYVVIFADHCECNVVVSVGLDDLTGEPA